jgi:16S rRNA (uracil1498-N3)-methyltransferase
MVQLQRLAIAPNQISNQHIALTLEQWHYLSRVLRLREGDRFIAMDGQGSWWLAAIGKTAAEAQVLDAISVQTELPVAVVLILALPKHGLDEVVRQATELGVTHVVPVTSSRTLLKPSPQKLERWQRIAQEAAEQSERQIVPEVFPPQPWTEALQLWNSSTAICYLCAARGTHPHLLTCLENYRAETQRSSAEGEPAAAAPITLAIGPEGGWTEAEVAGAIAAGYQPVSLGSRILRAVTAPLAALSIVASVFDAMPGVEESR